MDDRLIEFKEVYKRFGRKNVLEGLNLSIPENKITGIIGASGEGKTTILKLLVGFYKITKGEITYAKRNVYKERFMREIVGFSTEDGSFHDRLSVIENLLHFAALHHIKSKKAIERADELMDLVGLKYAQNTIAGNLSMGMKKRLDVAISLMHSPKILIMDEPTADLDPLLRKNMLDLIKKIKKEGTTIILTTQILGEMESICDKIVILYNKKILFEGTPTQINKKYKSNCLEDVFNKIFSKRKEIEIEVGHKLTKKQIDEIQKRIDKSIKRGNK
jgi:ABC-2 type transport system ATP-binding protein